MKILLIEDDQSIAKVISLGLKSERFNVDVASNGSAGIRLAVSNAYDLIILDILLPEKDGDEICKQLRNAGFDIPIIALTALGDLETKIKMFDLGVDDYITKPFEFPELLARIKSALRKRKIAVSSLLTYADIKMDLKKYEVTRAGIRLDLRDKEMKILEYFIRNAEQVLTRDMIMAYVWGPGTERFTNVVDVHIHHLREKLDRPFAKKLIKTVNNIGYKLSEK